MTDDELAQFLLAGLPGAAPKAPPRRPPRPSTPPLPAWVDQMGASPLVPGMTAAAPPLPGQAPAAPQRPDALAPGQQQTPARSQDPPLPVPVPFSTQLPSLPETPMLGRALENLSYANPWKNDPSGQVVPPLNLPRMPDGGPIYGYKGGPVPSDDQVAAVSALQDPEGPVDARREQDAALARRGGRFGSAVQQGPPLPGAQQGFAAQQPGPPLPGGLTAIPIPGYRGQSTITAPDGTAITRDSPQNAPLSPVELQMLQGHGYQGGTAPGQQGQQGPPVPGGAPGVGGVNWNVPPEQLAAQVQAYREAMDPNWWHNPYRQMNGMEFAPGRQQALEDQYDRAQADRALGNMLAQQQETRLNNTARGTLQNQLTLEQMKLQGLTPAAITQYMLAHPDATKEEIQAFADKASGFQEIYGGRHTGTPVGPPIYGPGIPPLPQSVGAGPPWSWSSGAKPPPDRQREDRPGRTNPGPDT